MEIRLCEKTDFASIKKLLKEFHEEALKEYGLKCEEGLMENAIKENFANALVLIVDDEVVGVIAGKIVDYPLQTQQIFQEMIFYIQKKSRGYGRQLLSAMENWCREKNIGQIVMVLMGNSNANTMDKWYTRCGYKKLEVQYIKNLS